MAKRVLFILLFLAVVIPAYGQEIQIVYTGETHAMLYPCNCTIEPDGGIARRATLIKQLKKNHPNTLLLDSGRFFAGGVMDEYSQNAQLDAQRTLINLQAMELMQYDAASIADDEFSFGRDFLEEHTKNSKINFISSNIKSEKLSPYLIKEAGGVKIGILGVAPLSVKPKAGGLPVDDPMYAVKDTVMQLKGKGVDIVVVLSQLGQDEDLRLANQIRGIDIIISCYNRKTTEPSVKAGSTLILYTSLQGRRLGVLRIIMKDKKITSYKVEILRLSSEIKDDPDTLKILPRCFADNDCKKTGLVGICQNPGNLDSSCQFIETAKVALSIIMPKDCRVCNTEGVIKYLRARFPGLTVTYIDYPGPQADKLIKDFKIIGLPVYLLGKEADKEKSFDSIKDKLQAKGDFYMLEPFASGISYFLDRPREQGKIDLFLSLFAKNTPELLDAIKDFNPQVHFLAVEIANGFNAAGGISEVEECLRSVCVQKYYPQSFWSYISCRAKNRNSSWWEDCLPNLPNSDIEKIRTCARGKEGEGLLKENIGLNKELKVMFGPTYLMDNYEIFGSEGVPSKDDFRKIFKGKEMIKP